MHGEIIGFFLIKAIKNASTVPCSVVKHLGSGRVFPYTSFILYRFLRALQQNRGQSRLLFLLNIYGGIY